MAEMVRLAIVACPLNFIRKHTVHVRDDFYRHIYKALAKDEAEVRWGIVGKDSLECVMQGWVARRL